MNSLFQVEPDSSSFILSVYRKKIVQKFGFSSEIISLCHWGHSPPNKFFSSRCNFLQRFFRIPHCTFLFQLIFFHPIFFSFSLIMNAEYFAFQYSSKVLIPTKTNENKKNSHSIKQKYASICKFSSKICYWECITFQTTPRI